MIYTIIILGPPYGTQNSRTGFLFSKALIKSRHLIEKIFFYGNGILNSNNLFIKKKNLNDKFNIVNNWIKLSQKYSIDLNFCIGSFIKRGIKKKNSFVNKISKKKNKKIFFKISSLMELSDSMLKSDRVMQF